MTDAENVTLIFHFGSFSEILMKSSPEDRQYRFLYMFRSKDSVGRCGETDTNNF